MEENYSYRTAGFDAFLNRGVPPTEELEDETSLHFSQVSASSLVPGITRSQDGRLIVNWAEEQIIITDGARNRVEIGKIPGTEEYGVRIYNSSGTEVFSSLGRIQTAGIESGAVGTDQIEDEAVTTTKILSLAADKITTGTLTAIATLGGATTGFVKIDGENNRIIVHDGTTYRIVIGNV